jgi:nucleoside-diphosphate-sugar epimerase
VTRVIITGACGFVGSQVVDAMSRLGYEVHALDRQFNRGFHSNHVTNHMIDLLDAQATRTLLDKLRPTGLIHLAWNTTHGEYWNSLVNLDWLAASLLLLRNFAASGGRRALLVGSSAEYKWGELGDLLELGSALQPSGLYGISKNALNQVSEKYTENTGMSYAWARLFNVFGPGESPKRLVPRVICTLLQNDRLKIDESSNIRDFLYASDAGSALAALYNSNVQGPVNVGSGEGVAIKDVISIIAEYLRASDLIDICNEFNKQSQPSRIVPSTTRLREEVGWSPHISLKQRLHDACDWWRGTIN